MSKKIVLKLKEIEAITLEAMIQASLNETFTGENFAKILKIENEKERTEECNLFLIGKLALEKIRKKLRSQKKRRVENE